MMEAENYQRDMVIRFKEIAGTESDALAMEFLERCQWDLELAVQEFMNHREGQPSALASRVETKSSAEPKSVLTSREEKDMRTSDESDECEEMQVEPQPQLKQKQTPKIPIRPKVIHAPKLVGPVPNRPLTRAMARLLAEEERLKEELKKKSQEASQIQKQQDAEFQESLHRDREKEQRRREEERQKKEGAERQQQAEKELIEKRRQCEQRREEIRRSLPPEPTVTESNADMIVRVRLRFPTGNRLDRRFLVTDSLELLYKAAFGHKECPENFSISTVFPKQTIRCHRDKKGDQNPVPTFAEAGLKGAVMLLVQNSDAE